MVKFDRCDARRYIDANIIHSAHVFCEVTILFLSANKHSLC
jgi:hypothetical protein